MSYQARLWFAPGVEVFPGHVVPSPPPQTYKVALREPMNFAVIESEPSPDSIVPIQIAEFRLVDYSPSGDVAHYEIIPHPNRGWRWIAANGSIIAERIR